MATLKEEFLQLLAGRDPATVVHHCGSGVSAVPNILAMELAGLGTTGPVCWQLERVVQRPCQAVRTGLEQAGDLPVVVDIDP
jgi:thiosulfate/3-mercaptopyruvate sulfurtransferase